jgi:hypothetical protein
MLEKKTLSTVELERQAGFELPERNMMALINVIVFDVIDGGVLNNLSLEVKNNNVAVQICAIVNLLANIGGHVGFACTVGQS